MSDVDPDHRMVWPEPPTPHPPLTDAVGRDAEEPARHYREAGFLVELVDVDEAVNLDLRPDRIRLFTRAGRVERAAQG